MQPCGFSPQRANKASKAIERLKKKLSEQESLLLLMSPSMAFRVHNRNGKVSAHRGLTLLATPSPLPQADLPAQPCGSVVPGSCVAFITAALSPWRAFLPQERLNSHATHSHTAPSDQCFGP